MTKDKNISGRHDPTSESFANQSLKNSSIIETGMPKSSCNIEDIIVKKSRKINVIKR